MSLITYWQDLRQAPETRRRRVAFGTSFVLTGLILVVWLINANWLFAPQPAKSLVGAGEVAEETVIGNGHWFDSWRAAGNRLSHGLKILWESF